MRKLVMKSLAALLALALLLTVLPATATTAKAADGDISSEGYVLFEENFDGAADALTSGHTYTKPAGSLTVGNGYLTDTNGTSNEYIQFVVNNVEIPKAQGDRCRVAIKMEIDIAEATGRKAYLQITTAKTASGTQVEGQFADVVSGANTSSITPTESATSTFFLKDGAAGNIVSFQIRVGARKDGAATNYIKIDAIRVSLVMYEISGKEALTQDIGMYLQAGTGYFQLPRDMTFEKYTVSKVDYFDVIMGDNAVLDLNGKTLTIAEGSTLNVPVGAKIIDTSAGKTGKIVCEKGALTFAGAHPTLPIRTADDTGYVLVEPKMIAETHIFVNGEQTADKFTLHFRPGFGTVGGVNVRETYLAGGKSGIQMTASITSKDIYNTETKLQYGGSEEFILDDVFNGMYASPEARGQMTFQGFEKYQTLKVTLKLSSCGAICTLPDYTVNNTKVTKHFASKFTTMDGVTNGSEIVNEQLKITNTANITWDSARAITTGAGKTLVMEFDASLSKTQGNYDGAGFEVRGTNVNGSPRYYLFSTGTYAQYGRHHYIAQANVVGGKHVRLEVNLENFSTVCTVDGVRSTAAPAAADLEYYIAAWGGKYAFNVSGATASNPFTIDNLVVYTIAS